MGCGQSTSTQTLEPTDAIMPSPSPAAAAAGTASHRSSQIRKEEKDKEKKRRGSQTESTGTGSTKGEGSNATESMKARRRHSNGHPSDPVPSPTPASDSSASHDEIGTTSGRRLVKTAGAASAAARAEKDHHAHGHMAHTTFPHATTATTTTAADSDTQKSNPSSDPHHDPHQHDHKDKEKEKDTPSGGGRTSQRSSLNADTAAATLPHHSSSSASSSPPAPVDDVDTSISITNRLKHTSGVKHFLNAIGDNELTHMSRSELELLWNKYDKDHNNVLTRHEIKTLAADVIERTVILIKHQLAVSNPQLTPEQIEVKLEKEKWFVLPGKNAKESEAEMTKMLMDQLDLNHDGKITKQEYLIQWNIFAAEAFKLKDENQLACSIM